MELVSIVIPCYNAEEYLSDAIESALSQTYSRCEVVVIDDGSTDRSVEILRSYGDRIRWETGPNRGGGAARNRGVEIAKGEWIQFLDADDLLLPECVASKMDYVVRHPEKLSEGLRPCSRVTTRSEKERLLCSAAWFLDHFDTKVILEMGAPPTPAPLLRKPDLKLIGGFRDNLRSSQEFDLFLRLALLTGLRFESVGVEGVVIRVMAESVSRGKKTKIIESNFDAVEHALETSMLQSKLGEADRRAFAARYRKIAMAAARCGDRQRYRMSCDRIRSLDLRESGDSCPGYLVRRSIFVVLDGCARLLGRIAGRDALGDLRHQIRLWRATLRKKWS